MKVFVLNCGSSSVKYQLFNMDDESVMAKGLVERIGSDDAILTHRPAGRQPVKQVAPILDHTTAIGKVLAVLTHHEHGVIRDISEIAAVGHRVVHGGESFTGSVLITEEVKKALRDCIDLAPLHNPPNLTGIAAAEALMPGVPQVAVFDTAFHSTMPRHAFLYAIPYVLYQRHKVRRYGFHGTSHRYVAWRAAAILGRPLETLKIISCHLGNGASIAAIKDGKSVDTSMGFTPLEGLMMGTRSGDVDPGVIFFVMDREQLTPAEANSMLNKHSGLVGLSGLSSDMREIEAGMAQGDPRAKDAFDVYEYRIRKYIGAYAAAMDGVDVIVFTAGVGENSPLMRQRVCDGLGFLGVKIDALKNDIKGKEADISAEGSAVKVLVIPTNEELVIARDTLEIVSTLPADSRMRADRHRQ
ncbi:MAG: acetate kinase [Firmicutes bacterium]|jgi:acetate kinase|nr:acetate kinase [Bacillota bacterium]MDH7495205.1 acetate kinase [Bacillota bacterium]